MITFIVGIGILLVSGLMGMLFDCGNIVEFKGFYWLLGAVGGIVFGIGTALVW